MKKCPICDKIIPKCNITTCSNECKKKYFSKLYTKPKTKIKCLQCEKITTNPKFCSQSCSATNNNTKAPKKQLQGKCFDCNTIISKTLKRCKECRKKLHKDIHNQTMKECMIHTCQRSGIYSGIRDFARKYYEKSKRCKCCLNCGYNYHYDICHIKAIADFDENTLISKINDPTNLVALCKNCHWEMDRGKLDKKYIQKLVNKELKPPS